MSDVEKLFRAFAAHLTDLITAEVDAHALAHARQAVFASLGMDVPVAKRRGRPPKDAQVDALPITSITPKARKKMPPQFCPVPGCKNKAAPIFGMVCSDHKGVKKSLIMKYRESRKLEKRQASQTA
jgi:hypothetical protein